MPVPDLWNQNHTSICHVYTSHMTFSWKFMSLAYARHIPLIWNHDSYVPLCLVDNANAWFNFLSWLVWVQFRHSPTQIACFVDHFNKLKWWRFICQVYAMYMPLIWRTISYDWHMKGICLKYKLSGNAWIPCCDDSDNWNQVFYSVDTVTVPVTCIPGPSIKNQVHELKTACS